MKKVCVCGAFLFSDPSGVAGGGQGIKTRELAKELKRQYGNVYCIDTCGRLNKLLLFFRLFYALLICKNIIILPAHNGVILETQYLKCLNILFRRGLHYVVIGGWLQDFLKGHQRTAKAIHSFDGIYVETKTMYDALQSMGYTNIQIMRNFKSLKIASEKVFPLQYTSPLRLVFFARVTEKKGLAEAVHIINEINKESETPLYSLDVFGPIDEIDREWFDQLKFEFTSNIEYKGEVPFEKSVDVLKDYFALLFPTKFYTEGIPGTIIDSYAAGLPVISSKWKSYADVVDDNITGVGYEFNNSSALKGLLIEISQKPTMISILRKNCLKKAEDYLPQNAIVDLKLK